MYLSKLQLWNFRRFGSVGGINLDQPHLVVPFTKGVNLLVGENDSGKTAIIDAIKLLLHTHSGEWIRIEHDDFFNDSGNLRIQCTFDDLTEDEAKNFIEWLSWTGEGEDRKYCLHVFVDITRIGEKILPYDVKAGAIEEGYALNAEARAYLKSTYLRPLRDAKSELIPKRNSRLSQILLAHDAFSSGNEHMFVQAVRELNTKVENYFEGIAGDGQPLAAHQLEGQRIKQTIDEYLIKFSGKQSKFQVSGSSLRAILETLSLLFIEGKNLGLGSHNVLCIASELLHLQKTNWTGVRLGLIEEIEAHLHPQVQMQVIETLHKEAEATNLQLIFTTHSPNIASKLPLANLIICSNGKAFPMGEDCTKLASTDYKFLERFLDVSKANMFFAKGVILVEGWAEELLLPALAKKHGINLTQKGVSIVNVGSTAFLRYSKIFQRQVEGETMSVPVAIITDVDVAPVESGPTKKETRDVGGVEQTVEVPLTGQEVETDRQAQFEKKTEKYSDQVVRGFISPYWTLEYCVSRSHKLRKLFYKSVLEALKEERIDEGLQDATPYNTLIENLNTYFNNWEDGDESIAYSIMKHILTGNNDIGASKYKISKAVIAQRFAYNLLADDAINDLQTEPSIAYLINAISYASSNN